MDRADCNISGSAWASGRRARAQGSVIGLFNASTGQAVNYLRTDPPSLLRLCDLWVSLLLLAGALSWLGVIGLVLALPAGLTCACAAMAVRLLVSRHHAAHIDEALDELRRMQNLKDSIGGQGRR